MNISKRMNKAVMVMKKCKFEGCDKVEMMHIQTKYCTEHRDKKYRKIIDKDKVKPKYDSNVIIKHDYSTPTEIKMTCECCGNNYNIILYPSVNIYPKFCEEHRNEFKRLLYMKQNGIINEIPKKEITMQDENNIEVDIDLIDQLEDLFME